MGDILITGPNKPPTGTQLPLSRPSPPMPHMLEVPAGPFTFGSHDIKTALKPRRLDLPLFAMSKTPITNGQFNHMIDAWLPGTKAKIGVDEKGHYHILTVRQPKQAWRTFRRTSAMVPIHGDIQRVIGKEYGVPIVPVKDRFLTYRHGEPLKDLSQPLGRRTTREKIVANPEMLPLVADNHPVTGITLLQAVAYATWLTRETGLRYRLPTEQEREKAAKGGQNIRYGPRDRHDKTDIFFTGGQLMTAPVSRLNLLANPFGFTDISGNVAEMTISLWSGSRHAGMHTPDSHRRVERNSPWVANEADSIHLLHTSYRNMFFENSVRTLLGFRVVLVKDE